MNFIKSAVMTAFALTALLCITPCTGQSRTEIKQPQSVEKWITSQFARGKLPPFSFVYDSQPSEKFIKSWKHSLRKLPSEQAQTIRYEATYTDPRTALEVRCDITGYADCSAVEWTLHFTNQGKENTPNIRSVKAADCLFKAKSDDDATLYTAWGSNGSRRDFQPREIEITRDSSFVFSPNLDGWGSSDTDGMPFFNLHAPTGDGVVIAIGWTGFWRAAFKSEAQATRFDAGMANTDLYLYPNESIRTPMISMLFWHGKDRMNGQNDFRRFVLAHHTRRINGEMAAPPLCGGFDWGDPAPCNEYSCITETFAKAIVERYRMFGIMPEVFWLDAAWYTDSGLNFEGRSWYDTVGDWTPDKNRFPNGLKPVSDFIHSNGAKLMVWFEPERVVPTSKLAVEHPEWMLKRSGSNYYLYDLGNPEACDFLCKYIGDILESNGIDYYRQDFNMPLAPYMRENDEAGRSGIREIRHIEGLYRYWDYLLTRFPQLQIDNCASGGRRIDLETTSRALPLWRTDYSYGEPNGYQNHTYGLSMFLPLHGTGLYHTDNYNSRSSYSSATVLNWSLFSKSGNVGEMQKTLAKYRKYRSYYLADFYPLSGNGDLTGDDKCIAYQLDDASRHSGIVVAFRRGADAPQTQIVALKGLDAQATYTLYDDNTGETVSRTGAELMAEWNITITDAAGSALFEYTLSE